MALDVKASELTLFRWRREFGQMGCSEAKELSRLRQENG